MKMSWQTETDRLECRWSEAGERIEYKPRWMREAAGVQGGSVAPSFLDFRRLSPFGGRRWFDPKRGYGSQAETQ